MASESASAGFIGDDPKTLKKHGEIGAQDTFPR